MRVKRFLAITVLCALASGVANGFGVIAEPKVLEHTRYLLAVGVMALFEGVMVAIGDGVGAMVHSRHRAGRERPGTRVQAPVRKGIGWGPSEVVQEGQVFRRTGT